MVARIRHALPEEGGKEAGPREIGKLLWRDMEHLSLPMDHAGCLVAAAVREKRAIRTETRRGEGSAAGPGESGPPGPPARPRPPPP